MLAVAGCGNNNDKPDDNANDNQEEANTNNEETETDSQKDDSERNLGTMKLGEAGLIDVENYRFEITPTSGEVFKERDDVTPSNNDVFVLIDFTIENVNDNPMEVHRIFGSTVYLENKEEWESDEKGDRVYAYDHLNYLEEVIEPGESYDVQLTFTLPESDEYILHYEVGSGSLENVEWKFTEDDIKQGN